MYTQGESTGAGEDKCTWTQYTYIHVYFSKILKSFLEVNILPLDTKILFCIHIMLSVCATGFIRLYFIFFTISPLRLA